MLLACSLGLLFAVLWLARWKIIAYIVSRPAVSRWLYRRAVKTPYWHLEGYMNRYWLFNPTPPKSTSNTRKYPWIPLSIRLHHILREDYGRDLHNHPWSFRTIVLDGWYRGQKEYRNGTVVGPCAVKTGDTYAMSHKHFHTITQVSPGGVWTLFIAFKWKQNWGFKTRNGFVPCDQYQGDTKVES